jgi:uncharacterized protein (DUF1684 family)
MDDSAEALQNAAYAAAVADWRLQTFDLYAHVRRTAKNDGGAPAHALWLAQRDTMFATHPASALNADKKARFSGLSVAPYNPDFRFECPLGAGGAGEEMNVQTGTDGTVPFVRLGTFDIPGVGALAAWKLRSYGGGIFVPFRDTTAGRDGGSYGAGRYLLDTVKGAHLGQDGGLFTLDFNFAYNPSCAYDEAWACPLPGRDNRLAVDIPVGELYRPELAD